MQQALAIILEAGRSAIELALYTLLPILIVMTAVMKLLEARGVLAWVGRLLSPVLRIFGIPGIGVFAALQMLFISFAAPASTLKIMAGDGSSKRQIAATLAMVLAMSQANAVFPLLTVGLDLPITLLTSLIGGLTASSVAYYLLAEKETDTPPPVTTLPTPGRRRTNLSALSLGGRQGLLLLIQSLPMLVLAMVFMKTFQAVGGIALLQRGLSPLLALAGLPGVAVLPIATKYLAGGTAMVGVVTSLVDERALRAVELNRMAGWMINPLDLVGVAVLFPPRRRITGVLKPALLGAAVGIGVRGLLHLVLF